MSAILNYIPLDRATGVSKKPRFEPEFAFVLPVAMGAIQWGRDDIG